MWTRLRAFLVSLVFLVSACGTDCPTTQTAVQFLVATLKLDGANAASWQSKTNLLPGHLVLTNPHAQAWTAAVADSAAVPASLGVIRTGAPDFGDLWIGLPFPMVTGQTLDFSTDQALVGAMNFDMLSAAAGPTAWVNTCLAGNQSPCGLQNQTVQGTLQVQESHPLRLRIDSVFSDRFSPSNPGVAVRGTMTFQVAPPDLWCDSYGDCERRSPA
jgi:hypothetical protein